MFEELNNRRKAVEQNIIKSFVEENDIEKAREKKNWSIGDTFTRHGITYRCTGISPNTGRPTWSKVKDGDGIKPEVGKYVDLDSRSSWDDIWDAAKKVAEKWWDEDGSKISGDKTKEEFVKEKMNSICFGFSASIPKKTVIANINTAHQHLAKLKEQKPKETKQMGKLSDLQVGDEVEIVEDNKGKITKKKGKITKVNAASFEVGGERFYKRTGYHVGMDNVKIQIPK